MFLVNTERECDNVLQDGVDKSEFLYLATFK